MRYLLSIFILFFSFVAMAQVTIVVDEMPAATPPDDFVYMAGSMNDWNPGDEAFKLSKDSDGLWKITLEAEPEGTSIQYKFTRGSWETVEKGENGEEIDNRILTYGNGDTVHVVIYNWRNGGSGGSTAAENVYVIDDDFYMPQLNKTRKIWIYLPPDYESSEQHYPVIYMQDGQNLFDDKTSFAGEWHVDETLNDFFQGGMPIPIVVGIDNGGADRINEYSPWINPQYGGGDGEKYVTFLAETLKPFIDSNYRTMKNWSAIMGSSMGALISHYASIRYNSVFSTVGIFSPSYWFSDSVYTYTREAEKPDYLNMYMMCGSEEGEPMIANMNKMKELINEIGYPDYQVRRSKIVEGGEHNEKLWSEEFGEAYMYLFEAYIGSINENRINEALTVYPNPVINMINFPLDIKWGKHDSLILSDATGKTLIEVSSFKGNPIPVCGLTPGVYFITIKTPKIIYTGQFIKN